MKPILFSFFIATLSALATQPNIVLIEVDDLTYTYAGAFGSETAKTPTIDGLAKQGFLFSQAMCQGTMCGPSRNCLITGTYPHQLGFYQNGEMRKLPKDSFVLPAAMQRAGYHTAWIGKSHLKPWFQGKKEDNFNEFFGFDHSLHTLGRALLGAEGEEKGFKAGPNPYTEHLQAKGLWEKFQQEARDGKNSTLSEDDYLDGWFARLTVDYIREYKEQKPLFLWVNFSLPHGPYDVPDPFHEPFAQAKMPGVTKTANYSIPASLVERTKTVRSEAAAVSDQRGYHAGIWYLDQQVKRILDSLQKRGMMENTWVVFFSDQGVMLGSLGLLHKSTLFRQITQPALIVRPPGGQGGGKKIDAPVELTDLLPTVMELGGSKEKAPAGFSLQPLFKGEKGGRKYSFAEIETWIAVTDGTWRLIRSTKGEAPLLFNDRKDPINRTNLAEKEPETVARLSAAIDEWLKATGDRKPPKFQ